MNSGDGGSWRQELAKLRERLDQLERQQATALESLRVKISELEKRAEDAVELEETPAPPVAEAPPGISTWTKAPPPLPRPFEAKMPVIFEREVTPRPGKGASFEMQFGRVWLVRFGIVLLLTGLVLLGNFAYQNWIRELPPGLRLAGLLACAGGLVELGRRLAARATTRLPGEVILAGGLAFFYYCVFAAHHVARLRVIENPVLAAILLLLAAGVIGAVSWFRNARTTAVLGLLLASYSTMLQPVGWLSCVSNVLLAGAGLFLMRRPGWAGPGVASMAGTYGAFLGWQLLGAAQGNPREPALLWFLPPVWILFSLPGLSGSFRESMSGRARAWFTGGNNAAFFLLFSGVWINRFTSENYWMLAAVFGLLLLVLGVAGRRRSEIAGGVNLSQGLTLLSLAVVLKLDGYHLALALGIESLALAAAFGKFRGRSEFAFSVLAGLGAVAMTMAFCFGVNGGFAISAPPAWSAGLTALLVAAASVVMRLAIRKDGVDPGLERLQATGLLFFAAVAAGIFGWGLRLPAPWPLMVLVGVSVLLSGISLRADRERKIPELCLGALLFLAAGVFEGFFEKSGWAIGSAALLALAGSWQWHRAEERKGRPGPGLLVDLKNHPEFPAWCFSAVTVAATWAAFRNAHLEIQTLTICLAAAGMALVGFGIAGRCKRLVAVAALLQVDALVEGLTGTAHWLRPALGSAVISLATLGMIRWLKPLPEIYTQAGAAVVRGTAFVAICCFWHDFAPGYSGDGLALMAMVLTAFAFVRKTALPWETGGYLGVAVLWLISESIRTPWSLVAAPTWRGAGIVAALLLLMAGPRLDRGKAEKEMIHGLVGRLASVVIALWATKMLVWRDDWKAVAVLWTLLGFAFVSVGLWARLKVFRQGGFALLALAVAKVFAFDVWDFNAFMRVISFIVLGVALILLGLFYNRFAVAVKRLLDDEEPPPADRVE